MISKILKKYHSKRQKKILIKTLIGSLSLSEGQKSLYLDALNHIDETKLDRLYEKLIDFSENIELKQIEDIQRKNFSTIAGMTKKEAEEKKQDINAFSFLLHNL